jgi:hypothetical protein
LPGCSGIPSFSLLSSAVRSAISSSRSGFMTAIFQEAQSAAPVVAQRMLAACK